MLLLNDFIHLKLFSASQKHSITVLVAYDTWKLQQNTTSSRYVPVTRRRQWQSAHYSISRHRGAGCDVLPSVSPRRHTTYRRSHRWHLRRNWHMLLALEIHPTSVAGWMTRYAYLEPLATWMPMHKQSTELSLHIPTWQLCCSFSDRML